MGYLYDNINVGCYTLRKYPHYMIITDNVIETIKNKEIFWKHKTNEMKFG